jgi:hypothetical protein
MGATAWLSSVLRGFGRLTAVAVFSSVSRFHSRSVSVVVVAQAVAAACGSGSTYTSAYI